MFGSVEYSGILSSEANLFDCKALNSSAVYLIGYLSNQNHYGDFVQRETEQKTHGII